MSSHRDSYDFEYGKLGKLCDVGMGVAFHLKNCRVFQEHIIAYNRQSKETKRDAEELKIDDVSSFISVQLKVVEGQLLRNQHIVFRSREICK